MKLFHSIANLIVLAALLLAAPAAAHPKSADRALPLGVNPVISIGVAADLTGPASSIGWQEANSVQLAVNLINAAGGIDIGGTLYDVTLVTEDGACNAGQGVTAANTLVAAGVVAVVGHTCSNEVMAAQGIYNAAGISMITPSATNPQITQQGNNTTFRTVSHGAAPPALLARRWRAWEGFASVALVEGPSLVWGNQRGDAFQNTFTALGGTITSRVAITSTAEFTSTLTTIQGESPAAIVYLEEDPSKAGLFSKVAFNLGMTGVPVGWSPEDLGDAGLQAYLTAAGNAAAESDYAAQPYVNPQAMPGWAAFLAVYQAANFANEPDDPGVFGAFAYDAAKIIFDAIDRANTTSVGDIRAQIAATANYSGVVGIYQGFDANGDVMPQWALVDRFQNGSWAALNPYFAIATDAVVGGVPTANEDILHLFDSNSVSMFFDGSDVGLADFAVDAFARLPNGSLLFSFTDPGAVPGVPGTVDDSDIVKFTPTSLGPTTSGAFSLYFDGSDVGLTTANEDVDALEVLSDGRLLISTLGAAGVGALSADDSDLLAFRPTKLGAKTAGSWSLYFDGSDVGLSTNDEDVDAVAVGPTNRIFLSTLGPLAAPGPAAAREDIVRFRATKTGTKTAGTFDAMLILDGGILGLETNNVVAIELP